jgi:hypothetical protein
VKCNNDKMNMIESRAAVFRTNTIYSDKYHPVTQWHVVGIDS